MAAEVLAIIRAGFYWSPQGREVPIRDLVIDARAGTVCYPPKYDCPVPTSRHPTTRIEVQKTPTLDAARRLVEQGKRPATLNFANATVPGGGFLLGARAQEEYLCRASGLYACLRGNPMYAFHEARPDALYTDSVIYSPEVPVFRGEDGRLLEAPWRCAFLTSAAPFATQHLSTHPEGKRDLESAFVSRIAKVLSVAALHKHDAVVLGAWGCGVFGNDASMVARVFREALEGPFQGVFSDVLFAIRGSSPTHSNLAPFRAAFPHREPPAG